MSNKPATWILFPALTMCLGWGLRGYIGGGPLGAMIPGAMVAMALSLLLKQPSGIAAAFGAIGVGFGGQETYGQTIGLTMHPETATWGLLGLTLKGAIWGLLGGAVIGTGLSRTVSRRVAWIASAALIIACEIGWKVINQPKLIYFSDPVNKPRAELWAGLLLAAIAYLLIVRSGVTWTFAWIACLGGGAGFGIGGWLNALGRTSGWHAPIDWWKLMEFTFGFLFGAALGYAAWKRRAVLGAPEEAETSRPLLFWLLLPLVPAAVAAEEGLPLRFTYMFVGACLLPLALANSRFAWQVAITTTSLAFAVDLLQSRPAWNQPILWLAVVCFAILTGWLTDRNRGRLPYLLLLLTWLAVGMSQLKSWLPPFVWDPAKSWPHANVEIAFTVMAIGVTVISAFPRPLPRHSS